MKIQEAARAAGLTRKAVLYYEAQGLITPRVEENGYRDYDAETIQRLRHVSILRQCGLGVDGIRAALDGEELTTCARRQRQALAQAQERLNVLDALARTGDWETASRQLALLEQKQSVLARMEVCLSGYFGRYLRAHFGPFLQGRVETSDQLEAFETIVAFWDSVDLPPALQAMLETLNDGPDADALSQEMRAAMEDIDAFCRRHREALEMYEAYRQTDAFRQTRALKAALEDWQRQSGYYDVFLPAMERLSPAYAEYREKLRSADSRFLTHR